MVILLFVFCGLIRGLLGGMLGIGGGIITVPALYFVFYYTHLFEVQIMQVASSTSLAISLFLSLFSAFLQHSRKAILFSAIKLIAPGLIIGCICGAILGHFISSELIRHIFGIGALLIGIYFAIPTLPHLHVASSPNRTLSFYGMDAKSSSATSSCTTIISSFIGTITYLLIAWKNPKLAHTFGYIDIPAFLVVGGAAMITTPLGVKLSHSFDTHKLKRIFGFCLGIVGLTMLLL